MSDSGDNGGSEHLDPNLVYSDDRMDKKLLEYVRVNGKLPPDMVKTIGYFEGIPQPEGDMIAGNLVNLPSDPYKAADTMYEICKDLMAQGSRKTADIRLTLEDLLASGEKNLGRQLMMALVTEDTGGYEILERSMEKVYKIYRLLPENSNSVLKDDMELDPELQKIHDESYRVARQRFRPIVDNILERNPEYKSLISSEKLLDAFINMPFITASQINKKAPPSDVVVREKSQLEDELF